MNPFELMNGYRLWLMAGFAFLLAIVLVVFWTAGILGEERYGQGLSIQRDVLSRRTDRSAGEIFGDHSVSQTFLAKRGELVRVDIVLITYGRSNDPDLIFTLSEVTRPGTAIRTMVASAHEIADGRFFRFEFPSIAESAGRHYVARLESPDGQPGNAFSAWVGNCDCQKDGVLIIDGEPRLDKDLAMQVVYSNGPMPVGEELVNRISQNKPFFFKGATLVVLGVASLILAAASLGRLAISVAPEAPHEFRWSWLLASVAVLATLVAFWL